MKKIFTLLSTLVLIVLTINARIVPVSTYAELASANTGALDGDTIVLTNGYAPYDGLGGDLTVTKKISVFASDTVTKTPEIMKFGFKLMNNSSIVIKGIKAYYDIPGSTTFTDSKYFIQAVGEVAAIDSIVIRNCEILNYGRGMVRSDNSTNIATIGKLIVDNCLVTNTSAVNAGYSTIGVKTAKISQTIIKNSTFANNLSGVYYSEQAAAAINFLMENVTIFNCGNSGAKNLINFVSNTGSSYEFKNIAMSGSFDGTLAKAAISILGTETAKLLNSIVLVTTTANPVISATWTENTLIGDVTKFILDNNYKITASKLLENIGDPRGYPMTVDGGVSAKLITERNPVTIVNGELVFNAPVKVMLYSINGKLIKSGKKVNQISISDLKKGMYVVKITDMNGVTKAQKFVK